MSEFSSLLNDIATGNVRHGYGYTGCRCDALARDAQLALKLAVEELERAIQAAAWKMDESRSLQDYRGDFSLVLPRSAVQQFVADIRKSLHEILSA